MSEQAGDNVVSFDVALKNFNRAKKVASRANKRLFLAAQSLSLAAGFDAKADQLVEASGDVAARSAKLLGEATKTLAHAVRQPEPPAPVDVLAGLPVVDREALDDLEFAVLGGLTALAGPDAICLARNLQIAETSGIRHSDESTRNGALAVAFRNLEHAACIRREDKQGKNRRIVLLRRAELDDDARGPCDGCGPLPGQGAAAPTTRPVPPGKPALTLVDPDYSPATDGPTPLLPVVRWLRDRGDRVTWRALSGAYVVDGLSGLLIPRKLLSYANSLRAGDGLAPFPELTKTERAGAA